MNYEISEGTFRESKRANYSRRPPVLEATLYGVATSFLFLILHGHYY